MRVLEKERRRIEERDIFTACLLHMFETMPNLGTKGGKLSLQLCIVCLSVVCINLSKNKFGRGNLERTCEFLYY